MLNVKLIRNRYRCVQENIENIDESYRKPMENISGKYRVPVANPRVTYRENIGYL